MGRAKPERRIVGRAPGRPEREEASAWDVKGGQHSPVTAGPRHGMFYGVPTFFFFYPIVYRPSTSLHDSTTILR